MLPKTSSIVFDGGSFTGDSITMTNINTSGASPTSGEYGSGIQASNMVLFKLTNSNFTGINYGGYGGAIYLETTLNSRKLQTSPVYLIKS